MPFAGNQTKRTAVPKEVQSVYRLIKQATGAVGGYGHNGPVYGEVTVGTFQKIVNYLRDNLDFSSESNFLDIGSGLGKPNFHVALDPGVKFSFGVELERLRYELSMHNLRHCQNQCGALTEVQDQHAHANVYFAQADITDIADFTPFTHIYMFDIGFPPDALVAVANSFNISRTVKALVSFQKPNRIIQTFGFEVELVAKIATSMCGSGEGHTAYIYRSIHNTKPLGTRTAAVTEGATVEEEVEVDDLEANDENSKDQDESSAPKRKRRTRSPLKRTRKQQTQLDKGYFRPSKRSRETNSKVTKGAKGKGLAKPNVLFPTGGFTDPLFQVGFDILNSSAIKKAKTLPTPSSPSKFSAWLEEEGKIGSEHTGRPRRAAAKRILYGY